MLLYLIIVRVLILISCELNLLSRNDVIIVALCLLGLCQRLTNNLYTEVQRICFVTAFILPPINNPTSWNAGILIGGRMKAVTKHIRCTSVRYHLVRHTKAAQISLGNIGQKRCRCAVKLGRHAEDHCKYRLLALQGNYKARSYERGFGLTTLKIFA